MSDISKWKLERCRKRLERCHNIARKTMRWLASTKSISDSDGVQERKGLAIEYLWAAMDNIDKALSDIHIIDWLQRGNVK